MKFISSEYTDGISIVKLNHLGKEFTGVAITHPEEENPSEYFGGRLAETRAEVEALKYERRLLKEKTDAMIDFVKSCENYAKFDKDSVTAKMMYRQLNKRVGKVNKLADEINTRLEWIQRAPSFRESALEAIDHRREYRTKEDNS